MENTEMTERDLLIRLSTQMEMVLKKMQEDDGRYKDLRVEMQQNYSQLEKDIVKLEGDLNQRKGAAKVVSWGLALIGGLSTILAIYTMMANHH